MKLQLSGWYTPKYEIVNISFFRRMSAMLDFRHIGISAILVSAILDLDIIFVLIIINWEFTLMLTIPSRTVLSA